LSRAKAVVQRDIVRYGWDGELGYRGAAREETVRKMVDELLRECP